MKLNKKGFTLVELLAVIVVLAILMLIAGTAVGPILTRTRKANLGNEGLSLVDAAKTAYQAETMRSSSAVKETKSACFDMAWLYQQGYYTKGTGTSGDGYTGSVLVTYNNSSSSTDASTYTYTFWISNGTYKFSTEPVASYDYTHATEGTEGSNECGGKTAGTVYCTGSNSCILAS